MDFLKFSSKRQKGLIKLLTYSIKVQTDKTKIFVFLRWLLKIPNNLPSNGRKYS